MFRFDAKSGYYLYPESNDASAQRLRLNSGSSYEKNVAPREDVVLTKLGLKIPRDATSYAEFVAKTRASELEFVSEFEP